MMELLLALMIGLLLGSFLNVCIYRLPRDLSVVRPRSHCPQCERTIAWYDNVPVLSYLLLKAKCRHCGARISWQYPVVELLTGLLFAAAVWRYGGWNLLSLKLALFSFLLIGLVFTDWDARILPDEFTKSGIVLGLLFAVWVPFDFGFGHLLLPFAWDDRWKSVIDAALVAAIAGGSFWLLGEIYYRVRQREGLGFGDVKLVAMIAAFYGFHGFALATLAGSLAGTLLGGIYILWRREDAASYELPYGTFLGVAALVVAFLPATVLF